MDRFSHEGCKVIIIDLDRAKGEKKQRADSNLHFLPGDVTRPETWESALALAQTTYGRVDVVVNNAGRNIQRTRFRIVLLYADNVNI